MARMPKPKPHRPDPAGRAEASYHHGDLRTALIAAARRILETEGLAALSLRAAARAAGVSQAAPYHHFANKDALLAGVAAEGFDELTEAMTRRMATETDPAQRLRATGVGYVAFAVANPELFSLMFSGEEKKTPDDPRLREAGRRAYGVLQSAIEDARTTKGKPADEQLAGLWAWCGVHGLAKLLIEQKLDPAAYGADDAETLAQIMLARVRI